MNYNKILEDLDLELTVIDVDITEISDKSNFPLKADIKEKLTALYNRQDKLGNLYNKIIEREDRISMTYFEDQDDYVESDDAYIPSIHNDQFSFNN